MKPEPDWDTLKAAMAAGASDRATAAAAGVPLRTLRRVFRRNDWAFTPTPAPRKPRITAKGERLGALALAILAKAREALEAGDHAEVERAARAVERLLKAEGLLKAQTASGPSRADLQAARTRVEDRLFALVEEEIARRGGARPDVIPLWRRLNRPDRRPDGDDPGPDWWTVAGG